MADFEWIKSSIDQEMPTNVSPVFVSKDKDGSPIYVGRARYDGDDIPAKVVPARRQCYIPFGGKEISMKTFEYLSGPPEEFSWRPGANGKVPQGAICSGTTDYNMPLYIGRVKHCGIVTPGKVHAMYQCLYISYGGKEHKYKDYEVLVWNKNASQHYDPTTNTYNMNLNVNNEFLNLNPTFKLF